MGGLVSLRKNKAMTFHMKARMLESIAVPTVLYGSNSWVLNPKERRMVVFNTKYQKYFRIWSGAVGWEYEYKKMIGNKASKVVWSYRMYGRWRVEGDEEDL